MINHKQLPKEYLDKTDKSSDQYNENFSKALQRLKDGKDATPRSWLFENLTPEKVLNMWISKLSTLNAVKDLKLISEMDLSKVDKFGPQGEVAPFLDRQATLEEYWAHLSKPAAFADPLWAKAKKEAIQLLGFNRTGMPYSMDQVIARGLYEDKYNTNAGDPTWAKRKSDTALNQVREDFKNGDVYKRKPLLGSRASMGKIGPLARWIFMFPMSVNVQEQRFQQPLQDYIRSKNVQFFVPWNGYDDVQKFLSEHCPGNLHLKFGCDYSKMDQHFNQYHAFEVFDVIKYFFKQEYWSELYDSINYTFNCDVIGPTSLLSGPHAMPSGSGWTNFLETAFNFILVQYFKLKYHLPLIAASGIGDDQLWIILTDSRLGPTKIQKLADFVVSIFKAFGLDANPAKQEVSYDEASFLQRHSYVFWAPRNIQWAGVYPTIRALTSLLFPEFYHNTKLWSWKMFALRCLMIVENCCNHPLFKEFVLFVAQGNPHIIEFAKLPDAEIILARQQAKKIANFMPSYNQEKMNESPTRFRGLKILREYAMKN